MNFGCYATGEEAARAADLAALAMRGREGAKTNFPSELYSDEQIAAARAKLREPEKLVKSSHYKGVKAHGPRRWHARLCTPYAQIYLGVFVDEEEAARRYDLAEIFVHGCDLSACAARVNFSDWSKYSTRELQVLTRDVGDWITARLVKRAPPAAVVQQVATRTGPAGAAASAASRHAAAAAGIEPKQAPKPAAKHPPPPATAASSAGRGAAAGAGVKLLEEPSTGAIPAEADQATVQMASFIKPVTPLVKEQQAATAGHPHPASTVAAADDGSNRFWGGTGGHRKRATAAKQLPSKGIGKALQQSSVAAPAAVASEQVQDPHVLAAAEVSVNRDPNAGAKGEGLQPAAGGKQRGDEPGQPVQQALSGGFLAMVAAVAEGGGAQCLQEPDALAATAAAVAAAKEKLSHARVERNAARHLSPQQVKVAKKAVKAAKAELKEAKAATEAAEAVQPTKSAAAAVQEDHHQHSIPQRQEDKQQQHSRKRPRDISQLAPAAMADNVGTTTKVKKEAVIPAVAAAAGQGEECQNPSSKQQQWTGSRIKSKAEASQLQQGPRLVRTADPQPSTKEQKRQMEPSRNPNSAASPVHSQLSRAERGNRLPTAAAGGGGGGGGVPTPPLAPVPDRKQPMGPSQPAAASGAVAAVGNKKKRRAAAAADDDGGGGVYHHELPPPKQHQQQHQQHQRALLQRIENLSTLLGGGRVQQISMSQPSQWDTAHHGMKKRRKISSKSKGSEHGG